MPTVELKDYTHDAEKKIATFAAICYDASVEPEALDRRIVKLLNLGHLATLRFAYATFCISGISRACSHQLVRSKHLDFLQESQRYVKQDKCQFVVPQELDAVNKATLMGSYLHAVDTYHHLISLGVRKEDARYVLPNAATTKLYVTGNFQAWKDFLKLRQDKAAQWEIREIANRIAINLYHISPNVFKPEFEKASLESR